jgi:hypothetical protein
VVDKTAHILQAPPRNKNCGLVFAEELDRSDAFPPHLNPHPRSGVSVWNAARESNTQKLSAMNPARASAPSGILHPKSLSNPIRPNVKKPKKFLAIPHRRVGEPNGIHSRQFLKARARGIDFPRENC